MLLDMANHLLIHYMNFILKRVFKLIILDMTKNLFSLGKAHCSFIGAFLHKRGRIDLLWIHYLQNKDYLAASKHLNIISNVELDFMKKQV